MSVSIGRLHTFLLVMILLAGMAIVGLLASRSSAGSLDPPRAPASTMHTLDEIPASWDRVLSSTNGAPIGSLFPAPGCGSDRFECVMTFQDCSFACTFTFPAILDRETGLVWERSPSTIGTNWDGANFHCGGATTGNRGGWRLPTLAELTSLLNERDGLPAGSPFSNVQNNVYWTSTSDIDDPLNAWSLGRGSIGLASKSQAVQFVWCVRGATSDR